MNTLYALSINLKARQSALTRAFASLLDMCAYVNVLLQSSGLFLDFFCGYASFYLCPTHMFYFLLLCYLRVPPYLFTGCYGNVFNTMATGIYTAWEHMLHCYKKHT